MYSLFAGTLINSQFPEEVFLLHKRLKEQVDPEVDSLI
jgi:hypothetical protein